MPSPAGLLADALAGIRILDLSRLLPGPFLTMLLADLGADVIKVEDPKLGDYMRQFPPAKGGMGGRFLAVNRGKRSIVLDLKAAAGREALLRLAARVDVVVESFRPGVIDKLGVGYAALAAVNPGIIVCSISGFGQTGPYVERAGHDLGYIAVAGVLAMGGPAGGAPLQPGVQIADLAGGSLWGATAILAALVGRHRTGRGAHLDISMTEGALALLSAELGNLDCGARPTRGVETLNGGLACYGIYRTADDRYLAVGALEPKFWIALHQAIGRPANVGELIGGPDVQARVRAELAAIFATRPAAEWNAILAAHDCCVELVTELDELPDHPLHRAREVFFTIDGGAGVGPVQQVRTPLGTPKAPRPPPKQGEHTREVLAEYGFSDAEIAAVAPAPAPTPTP
ncbi:MAG TPA: CaiB/BaiF CoA-transferase family protein [Kofleriaceae bacterium]|jgi:crotonobetainyl-CoA:carnitine CoA-transferase CaiB-like acyl-CoA transferase|nr:CaiB/BaiF CoA-transferase family protein [Kofleriaceae bacterium]